ncbi:MAG: hypothetical protein ACRDXX_08320 [Stackebrandtia sp.]
MPQVDLIIETYVHAPAEVVAPDVDAAEFAPRLWRDWSVRASQRRGTEGVRWELSDARLAGTCEVWIQRLRDDSCLLHTFARVDPRGRPWPAWRAELASRRFRARLTRRLWRFKDDVEKRAVDFDR